MNDLERFVSKELLSYRWHFIRWPHSKRPTVTRLLLGSAIISTFILKSFLLTPGHGFRVQVMCVPLNPLPRPSLLLYQNRGVGYSLHCDLAMYDKRGEKEKLKKRGKRLLVIYDGLFASPDISW